MSDLSKYRRVLAELAGVKLYVWDHGVSNVTNGTRELCGDYHSNWRPDEDVAQAIQCLEALDLPSQINNTTHNPRRWIVDIWVDQDGTRQVNAEEPILSQAICLAIIDALDLKPETS